MNTIALLIALALFWIACSTINYLAIDYIKKHNPDASDDEALRNFIVALGPPSTVALVLIGIYFVVGRHLSLYTRYVKMIGRLAEFIKNSFARKESV